MEKAVFLDRDGTVIEDSGYVGKVEAVKFMPGAGEAVRLLNEGGFRVVVATNQAGVARGFFTEEDVERVNDHVRASLAREGATIDRFYYCPHHIDGVREEYRKDCRDRKPNPGMLERASRDMDIRLADSWMVGDFESDIEAGRRAGCRTVLLSGGNRETKADYTAPDLLAAAKLIIRYEHGEDHE
jgi:D-glycero-D-manno-heptose 1,7-bisphosphate phosphatase